MKKTLFLHWMIVGLSMLLLAGCANGMQEQPLQQIANTITPEITQQPTRQETESIINSTHITTPMVVETLAPLESDIIINYGIVLSCGSGDTELFLLHPPYEELVPLVGSQDGKDFYKATWSPDGQWIAYVEETPAIIKEGHPEPPLENSKIVLISADGLEKKVFDTPYPTKFFQYIGGMCEMSSTIIAPIWSEDGSQIVSSFLDNSIEKIFIIDLVTGITKTILEEFDFYETRMWLPDLSGFAITNDDKTIDMYLIKQEHAILEKSIPVPEEIPDEVEIRFKTEDNFITLEEDGKHVFCYFRKSTYSTGVVYEALWDLNLESGTWKKLTGFENDPSPYRGLIITRDFVVTSSEAGLIVYDRMDWHTFPLDTEKLGEFGLGSKLPARYGANTIVLWSKDQEGDEIMWIAQINPTVPQFKRVFSVKELGLEDTYNPKLGDYGHYEMFNYAWQP